MNGKKAMTTNVAFALRVRQVGTGIVFVIHISPDATGNLFNLALTKYNFSTSQLIAKLMIYSVD